MADYQNCQNCPLREQLARLEQKYSESRQRIYERIEALENEHARTDERYQNISRDLGELKDQQKEILERIEKISQKPGQRWETAVAAALSALISGVVAYFVSGGFK